MGTTIVASWADLADYGAGLGVLGLHAWMTCGWLAWLMWLRLNPDASPAALRAGRG
jgi:hypothetical protein